MDGVYIIFSVLFLKEKKKYLPCQMPLTSYDFPSILPFLQATIHAGNKEKNTKNEA